MGEDLAVKAQPFGYEAKQSVEGHLLDRLRGGTIDLAGDVKPLGVGVDPELDRGVGSVGLGF